MRRRDRWALAIAASGSLALLGPSLPAAAVHTEPTPIPGGLALPDGSVIHIWLPGPADVVLPLSGLPLMGLDVEPITISDVRGFAAMAYLIGTATDADGNTYDMEADLRLFRGRYIASDGNEYRGTFVMI